MDLLFNSRHGVFSRFSVTHFDAVTENADESTKVNRYGVTYDYRLIVITPHSIAYAYTMVRIKHLTLMYPCADALIKQYGMTYAYTVARIKPTV